MLVGCSKNASLENSSNGSIPVESAPAMEETILNFKVLWDGNDNLYEVSLDVLNGVAQSKVYRFGNDLLFAYDEYDAQTEKNVYVLKLISLKSGELLYEQQIEPLTYGVLQILDNHVAVNDLGEGKCYLLNEKLEMVDTYELQGGMFCLDKKCEKAYVFTYDRGIEVVDLAGGTTSVIPDAGADMYLCEAFGNEATFIYTDRETLLRSSGVLDLNSGEIRTIESPYAFCDVEVSGDTWLGDVEGVVPFYVLSDGKEQGMFYGGLDALVGVNNASGHMTFYSVLGAGDKFLSVYDNQGNLLSSCDINGFCFYEKMDFAWYEEYNGYVFSLTDDDGKEHLMFWEISDEVIENDLDLESVEDIVNAPVGTAVPQGLFDRAKNLSEKYGVEILIADQCDTVFSEHDGDLLLDEEEIEQALDTLDYVLGKYPEGFFEQLKHNTYKEIEIQILGMLTKSYSTEEATYISGGFVDYSYPGKFLMALDARPVSLEDAINPIMEETMYHEFSHIIDKRLEYASRYREDAVYSDYGWIQMNPEGFEYNDTYYGTLDPIYEDYFVDAYACTNGTEDRARIMEYAMIKDKSVFEGKEGLTKKLEYYCEGIRDSFDTTGWPEVLPWEEVLN